MCAMKTNNWDTIIKVCENIHLIYIDYFEIQLVYIESLMYDNNYSQANISIQNLHRHFWAKVQLEYKNNNTNIFFNENMQSQSQEKQDKNCQSDCDFFMSQTLKQNQIIIEVICKDKINFFF